MKVRFRTFEYTGLLLVLNLMLYCSIDISSVVAAPFWLKPGTYAYYDVETFFFYFKNGTAFDSAKGIYGWRCLSVGGNSASLEVIFQVNLTDSWDSVPIKPGTIEYKRTFVLTVNMETRESYADGVFMGFVPFWIETNVQMLQNITMSYAYNRTLKGTVYGAVPQVRIQTPYRNFTGDEIWNVATESVNLEGGMRYHGMYFFEKDSGILIAGSFWGDLFDKLEIDMYAWKRQWPFELLDTNIEFREPAGTSPFQTLFLYAAGVTAALAITTLIYLIKMRRKHGPLTDEPKDLARHKRKHQGFVFLSLTK